MSRIFFLCLSLDHDRGKEHIVVSEDLILPHTTNNLELMLKSQLKNLIEDILNVDFEWLKIRLYNVRNNNNELEIYYCFNIPLDPKLLKNGYRYITLDSFLEDEFIYNSRYIL